MWLGAQDCARSLWVVTVLVMRFCVCLCERVFGTVGWRVIRREDPSPVSIKVAGSPHFLLSPGSAHFFDCSRHTSRENTNISKTSTDNSHPPLHHHTSTSLSSHFAPFCTSSLCLFFPNFCNLSLVSLRLSSLRPLSLWQAKHHCHGERDDNNEAVANHTDC